MYLRLHNHDHALIILLLLYLARNTLAPHGEDNDNFDIYDRDYPILKYEVRDPSVRPGSTQPRKYDNHVTARCSPRNLAVRILPSRGPLCRWY